MSTTPRRFLVPLVLLAAITLAGCGLGGSGDETPAKTQTEEADDALTVTVGKGIGPVAVGDEREQLVEAFGDPDESLEQKNEFSGGMNDRLEWTDPAIAAVVVNLPDDPALEQDSEIIQLETTDEQVRTGNGLGIGASRADIEAAYPEVDCDDGSSDQVVLCRLGQQQAGSIVTDFFLEDDAVTRIVVGRIID